MEFKKLIESIQKIEECPPEMGEAGMMPPAPMDQGSPVTMNVNLSATGADHVSDLINMMKNAGLNDAKPVDAKMLSPRMDMERLAKIVGEPGDEDPNEDLEPTVDDEEFEGYENEPDEDYKDQHYMTKDLAGGINREKKQYKAAQPGDNAMAMENIKAELYAALAEKKAKPDYIDIDGDGDTKEPMKKAAKEKGSKPKKGEVPPQFKKK